MRERTTWDRHRIASQLQKVAEDPRSMNQDHIQQQPAADAYVIGGPSEFAEDVNSGKNGWKADLGSDGNTKRNEIGLPEFRGDTFNNPEESPGVSPSRQASLSREEVYARAELATKAARLMLPRTAAEKAIEEQALLLMDMPTLSLQSTLNRLAQQQGDDDDDGDDEGQDKQAQQEEEEEEEDDDDEAQAKQAKKGGGLPPEFLEQQQKMKDKAKGGDKDEKKDEKKEARARKAQQDDKKQSQDQDDKKQSQQAEKEQGKEARARKAQQDDGEADDDQGQDKQARARKAQQGQQDDDDQGQDKEAADQDDKKQSQQQDKDKEACGPMGKEASSLIRQTAVGLLSVPQSARQAAYQAMLPLLLKTASQGLQQMGQQQLSQQQLQSQVQQLVQQAMQDQLGQGQQGQGQQGQQPAPLAQAQQQMPALADDSQALVDQLFQDQGGDQQIFASSEIQMDSPTMDIGDVSFSPEDSALQAIFASDLEVQQAMQAHAIQSGNPPVSTRTASTRTVGTRPTEGVSQLGGGVGGSAGGASEEISRLSGMWSSAPDVSSVFRS